MRIYYSEFDEVLRQRNFVSEYNDVRRMSALDVSEILVEQMEGKDVELLKKDMKISWKKDVDISSWYSERCKKRGKSIARQNTTLDIMDIIKYIKKEHLEVSHILELTCLSLEDLDDFKPLKQLLDAFEGTMDKELLYFVYFELAYLPKTYGVIKNIVFRNEKKR